MRCALLLAIVFASCAPALGQDAAPAADIAPVLSRSLTPAALKRVLGQRFFKDKRGGLVTVTCALDDDERPRALRCEVELRAIGAMREETLTLRCELGLDGRLRRSSFRLVRGVDRVEAAGPIRDGVLRLDVKEARGDHTAERKQTVTWTPDALPFGLAAFVLPLLDLPEELTVRVYHPVTMAVNADPSAVQRKPSGLTLAGVYPGLDLAAKTDAGRLTEVRLGTHERYTAISAEQAADLLR